MPGAYANLDGLVRLSQRQGIDIRRPLLRVLTDLYVQEPHHTREQEQQFVELAQRLLPDVDPSTRVAIARKLLAYSNAPAQILNAIADLEPEVRALVAAVKPQQTEPVVHTTLAEEARSTPIAVVAAAIEESQPRTLGETFLRANAETRTTMLYEHTEDATIIIPGRAGVAQRLESAALRRNQEEMVRELRRALEISNRTAWRIIQDESGEPLLIAGKALGMSLDAITRVLLFVNPSVGESIERVFSLASIYSKTSQGAGITVLQSWREEAAARPRVRFQSITASDGAADTRTTAHEQRTTVADHAAVGKRINE
ncbi:hypothetical protein GJW-30_1_03815 [Variibacter gotjawalensis]|uniref:DUF2336 domain-containing protein n=2 Tax=Variibacter gotjawalensis TaxID=1333996 RepID=A0A0S3PZ84_9BRAD|nr:hypothetical protein [Variibacter gotjawalensis]NIK47096.1 hypothetical protein [Variibacter gotjawalensis]RZS48998.1 hypothetical protein EV661_1422 [Variibacter gotjawalensis]BAT61258.1 hypothetical protein GJW-30_1_03815 [Variibacter gotjawalensis]